MRPCRRRGVAHQLSRGRNRPGGRTPPRRGSDRRRGASGPRLVPAIAAAASAGDSADVLSEMPAAADRRIGPAPQREREVDQLLERGQPGGRAGRRFPCASGRGRRRTRRAGCRAAGRAKRRRSPDDTAIPGLRSRPSDRPAASGLIISAAPERKSDTTASIGMPLPAIMMPVCPVARKSAARPRSWKARASASAVYFLPSAQSVPTVSSRLPLRLRPEPIGNARRRRADVDQRPSAALRRLADGGNARQPDMHPADDVEPGLDRLDQRRNPRGAESCRLRWRRRSPAISRPACSASAGVMAGSPVVTVASGKRELADAPLSLPSRATRGQSWRRRRW